MTKDNYRNNIHLQKFACGVMGCVTSTITVLKDAGHRATPQRLLILSTLRHARGHLTVAQIQNTVHQLYPTMNASTIYRNLATLKSLRLISETRIGSEESLYEWIDEEKHHHIVCRNCSMVLQIDNNCLSLLSDSLLKTYGFTLDTDHFAIAGVCSNCSSILQKEKES